MPVRPVDYLYLTLLFTQVILTIVIGIWAYRGYRLLKDKRLLKIYLGFTVIGGGIFVQLLLSIYTSFFRPQFFLVYGEYASALAQLLGYLIIVIGYYRPEEEGLALQIIGASIAFQLLTIYLICAILIMFILYRVILSYMIYKERKLLYSILAFTLLTFSYLGISISMARPDYKFISNVARLMGFLILAASIYTGDEK